jgi:hypothetical protein
MAALSREIQGEFSPAWKEGTNIFSAFIIFIFMQIV